MIVLGKVTIVAPSPKVTSDSKAPLVGSLGINTGEISPGEEGKY